MTEVLRTMLERVPELGDLQGELLTRGGSLHARGCALGAGGEPVVVRLVDLLTGTACIDACSQCRASMLFGATRRQPMRLERWAGTGRALLAAEHQGRGRAVTGLDELLTLLGDFKAEVGLKAVPPELERWREQVVDALHGTPEALIRSARAAVEEELLEELVLRSVQLPAHLMGPDVGPALAALRTQVEATRAHVLADRTPVLVALRVRGSLVVDEAWMVFNGSRRHDPGHQLEEVVRALYGLRHDLFVVPAAALPWMRERFSRSNPEVLRDEALTQEDAEAVKVLHDPGSAAYATLASALAAARAL